MRGLRRLLGRIAASGALRGCDCGGARPRLIGHEGWQALLFLSVMGFVFVVSLALAS